MKKILVLIVGLQGCATPPLDPEAECFVMNTHQSRAIQSKIVELSQQLEQGYIEKTHYESICVPGPRGGVVCGSGETQYDYVPIDSSEWRARIKQLEATRSKTEKAEAKAAAACLMQRGTELAETARREGVDLADVMLQLLRKLRS